MSTTNDKFKFAIDRGGTFTDVFAKCPGGKVRVLKLLSEDPQHYKDAPTEGIRRILQEVWNCVYFPNQGALKDHYASMYPVAHTLCVKHLQHRKQLHEKRRIDDATTDSILTENFIASLPERQTVRTSALRWIPNDLNPFIVRPVQSQVEEKQPIEYLTEMRQVTILFINIVSTTFQESKLVPMVNKAFQMVCKIVHKVRGVVNKVSLFDKDVMILVLFGLRGIEHELESQNALKSAFTIRKSIKKLSTVKSISIGITNGWVYCGVVGHPFRREYTVIGGPVNKAARIMCAYEDKVTCDHDTYKSCKLSSLFFQLQSAMQLKGIADAGHIFEYNEDFDQTIDEDVEETMLIGRDLEMELADVIMKKPELAGWTSICFKGETKVGKTKLLQEIRNRYATQTPFVCSITLNEALQRGYYSASSLYQQLYDVMSEKNPKILTNLPRELWDWNEILQSRHSTSSDNLSAGSKERLQERFLKMCKGDATRSVIFFIDNVQFVDHKSLELFEVALQKKVLRLICSGCFEDNATWNTMWKISLSTQIKLFNVEPLKPAHIAFLMCNFLKVKGISKKLIVLINKTCEGRPGWVQACLLKMINNGELEVKYAATNEHEYAFLEDVEERSIVSVAGFSKRFLERGEETSSAITLDLFDSFSPYQQLIIKTAAVLGEIFTRTTLIVLLKYPNESMLATAIKTLFEEEVFDCASRYVNSGGLQEKKNICLCYMDDDEYGAELEIPRYAFCKVLHFKGRNIRLLAYELLPLNQKKELHLRITDLLENQNNSCPNCLRDNSASLIAIRHFNDLIKYCHDEKYIWTDKFDNAADLPLEAYKNIIRDCIHNRTSDPFVDVRIRNYSDIPKRKIWDPSTCFCLEILLKVYRDLIHHSHCAQHLGKKIFFMLEYGVILFWINELEEAVSILNESSELCMVQTNKAYLFTGNFKKMMMGKIHCLLGNCYMKMGNMTAAKNHAILSLRQYDVPMISFKYSLPHRLLNMASFARFGRIFNPLTNQDNPLIKLDFAMCMSLISNIYASEGHWKFAKHAAARSVVSIRRTNPNIDVLCDIYTGAVHLYSFCGDIHICEKLERSFNKDILKYYTNNITKELYSISTVIGVLFMTKALSGNLTESIRLGHRAVHLDMSIEATYMLMEVVPVLASNLMLVHRIAEAVYIARLLNNIGIKYHSQGYVGYYAFCMELILETNFYLETVEAIEAFAAQYLDPKKRYTYFGNKLVVNIYAYHLRNSILSDAIVWKKIYNWGENQNQKFVSLVNLSRCTECLLLEQVRCLEQRQPVLKTDIDETNDCLKRLKGAAQKWPYFMPRYLHMKAYYYRINNKTRMVALFLNKANSLAAKQGNVLEQCWISLHRSCWFGGFSFDRNLIKFLDWKMASSYSPQQWCHLLYPLPYY